jgi:hypothetical protein
MIAGLPGQGLLLLRLAEVAGDARWVAAARGLGDAVLAKAVRAGAGIKFAAFALDDGRTVYYPGMAHGAAGAGYFLSRLARALPAPERAPYAGGARAVGAWLDGLARPNGAGVNWYRREPDQTGSSRSSGATARRGSARSTRSCTGSPARPRTSTPRCAARRTSRPRGARTGRSASATA